MNKSDMLSASLARKAFIDSHLQEIFDRDGYVSIPRFLDEETRVNFTDLYNKYSSEINSGFHVTNWISDSNYRNETHESICSLLSERLKTVLDNYKPVLGCFAVKEGGDDNSMGLHQDWSVTDESKFYGLSVWIPLVDTKENSGALKMLSGSHRLFQNIRGQKLSSQLDNIPQESINRFLTTVPMKAGDLLVLHHRIVHCSGHTPQRRIAVMMASIPVEAEVKHYIADSDGKGKRVRSFTCRDDFYAHFDIDSPPPAEFEVEGVDQSDFVVTESELIDYYTN